MTGFEGYSWAPPTRPTGHGEGEWNRTYEKRTRILLLATADVVRRRPDSIGEPGRRSARLEAGRERHIASVWRYISSRSGTV